jgi:hypothetical protein
LSPILTLRGPDDMAHTMADVRRTICNMTRDEAMAEAQRLAEEHSDRATHSWIARDAGDGDWAVVRLGVPTARPRGTTQESKPRPPQADDPRPALWRDVGGPYGAG